MLTRSQFECACRLFIEKQNQRGHGDKLWSWTDSTSTQSPGFISRSVFFPSPLSSIQDNSIDDNGVEQLFEDDCITEHRESSVINIQQHVVFHPTFRVPAFYFAAHYTNGAPLTLAEILRTALFHSDAFNHTEIGTFGITRPSSSFPLLSQGEHPITGAPCWYLHPCRTDQCIGELMAELQTEGWSEDMWLVRWLEAWLMILGTVVRL